MRGRESYRWAGGVSRHWAVERNVRVSVNSLRASDADLKQGPSESACAGQPGARTLIACHGRNNLVCGGGSAPITSKRAQRVPMKRSAVSRSC